MGRRHKNDGASISLLPILSIQKCTMGVMVVIICAQTMVSIGKTADQYLEIVGGVQDRQAVYVECQAKGVLIHPEKTEVALDMLKGPGPSAFHQLLDELAAAKDRKYLVLLIRPDGIATFEYCFKTAKFDRKLEVGKDALLPGGNIVLTKEGKQLPTAKKGAG
jgi:hypothetical protein